MPESAQRYEVYSDRPALDESGAPSPRKALALQWIWRRLNEAGAVMVHGSHHGSLEACFAAARKHREAFGDAPIAISLNPDMAAPAASRATPNGPGRPAQASTVSSSSLT